MYHLLACRILGQISFACHLWLISINYPELNSLNTIMAKQIAYDIVRRNKLSYTAVLYFLNKNSGDKVHETNNLHRGT